MENKVNKEIVRNLVKTKAFPAVPHIRGQVLLSPVITHSLTDFSENTDKVVRVSNLCAEQPMMTQKLAHLFLVRYAFEIIRRILITRRNLRGEAFTIIDGTTWADSMDSRGMVGCILFANVYWDEGMPIIAVVLGRQKTLKTDKVYRIQEKERTAVIFEYDPMLLDEEMDKRLIEAVETSSSGAQFGKFGKVIAKGLTTTARADNEYPVAAATLYDDVIWYVDRPYRHFHISHSEEFLQALLKHAPPAIQGFLTNHGNFVSRYRGMYQAYKNNMLIDSEGVALQMSASEVIKRYDIEGKLGGIIQADDNTGFGYRVSMTAVFSEDLW
jgi:hypothetical protein